MQQIILKNITSCTLDQQMAILTIRNQDLVRLFMYNDHVILVNEHLSWLSGVKKDKSQISCCILAADQSVIGLVRAYNIDARHKRAEWGFYLTLPSQGKGIGSAVEYYFIEYLFNVLLLEKINAEGQQRGHIIKNGKRVDICLLGLTIDDWLNNKDQVLAKHKLLFTSYNVKIIDEEQETPSLLSQIEQVRGKNNINWIALLKLAIDERPNLARPIISEILRLDRQISALTEELVAE